ncbi:hypothetical protein AB6A40_010334, partial [Gnathostoma spinigerum]
RDHYCILNDRHSYFLLVDNGTCGRYGADIVLRRRLEQYIAQKKALGCGTRRVPIVCAVLEGGTCTIRAVNDYLNNNPPVPVIVCDGSGRASDLIAFAHRYVRDDGTLPKEVASRLLSLIEKIFSYSDTCSHELLDEILQCARQRDLLTVFRLGKDKRQDVDHAILTALLRGQNLSPFDQLALALAWNRVDIARADIFMNGKQWPSHSLHSAMMDALALDRVEFVKLFLENGLSIKKFLTISRLEQLYNINGTHSSTLRHLIGKKTSNEETELKLPVIGAAIERIMGNVYKSYYTSRQFKNKYSKLKGKDQMSAVNNLRNIRAVHLKTRNQVRYRNLSSSFDYLCSFTTNTLLKP